MAYVFFVSQFCLAMVEGKCEVPGWQGCGSAGGGAGSAGGILELWRARAMKSALGTGPEVAFTKAGGVLAPDLGSICGD